MPSVSWVTGASLWAKPARRNEVRAMERDGGHETLRDVRSDSLDVTS
jgi:hypothetical protein